MRNAQHTSEGAMDGFRKIKTIRGCTGMARFVAECGEDVAGWILRPVSGRYAYATTVPVFRRGDELVFTVEIKHRVYVAYAVDGATVYDNEDAAFAARDSQEG